MRIGHGGGRPSCEKILPMVHPYADFIHRFAQLMDGGRALPMGGFPSVCRSKPDGPEVLVFAPHPDDESIVGALPLRLLRELNHRVTVVAVTLGSRPDRQSARLEEMRGACAFLGFGLIPAKENGLDGVHPETRKTSPSEWLEGVRILANMLRSRLPLMVVVPHGQDLNTTHQGTHLLVLDALQSLGPDFNCLLVETEFWAPMAAPNLMIESSQTDVADLMAAVSFHRGEVERNPYHLRLPAWMSDNVRRGGELVGGQGGPAPDFRFATLYRLQRWHHGHLEHNLSVGCVVPVDGDLAALFHQD